MKKTNLIAPSILSANFAKLCCTFLQNLRVAWRVAWYDAPMLRIIAPLLLHSPACWSYVRPSRAHTRCILANYACILVKNIEILAKEMCILVRTTVGETLLRPFVGVFFFGFGSFSATITNFSNFL